LGRPTAGANSKRRATLDDQNIRPKVPPIVPWGHAWRTGANEATTFVVTADVLINGQKLPQAAIADTIPTKDEWTIISIAVANQWAASGTIRQGHLAHKR